MPRKTYAEMQEEIAKLQKEAEEVREAELAEVIDKINKAVAVYGLLPSDLHFPSASRPRAQPSKARPAGAARGAGMRGTKTNAGAAKYEDDQGNAWVGRGPRPQWLRAALDAGRSLEDFRA